MSTKGKVITAIIVAVVLVAGGVGFYFKGGDLMGRMTLKPAYDETKKCSLTNYERMFSNTPVEKIGDFDSLFDVIKNELNNNNKKTVCPLRFQAFARYDSTNPVSDYWDCRRDQTGITEDEFTKTIYCHISYSGFSGEFRITKTKDIEDLGISVAYEFGGNGWNPVQHVVGKSSVIVDRIPLAWINE